MDKFQAYRNDMKEAYEETLEKRLALRYKGVYILPPPPLIAWGGFSVKLKTWTGQL